MARRGACPGLFDPMPTGDGLLARLPPAGPLAPVAFVAVCRAAARHGNGLMEVTARGSLQVRGLTPPSSRAFAEACLAAGIRDLGGPPVIANSLGGTEASTVSGLSGLVEALRAAVRAFAGRVGSKVAIVVDGGGALNFDGVSADIRLRALGDGRLMLGLAGDGRHAQWLGAVAAADAVAACIALLEAIAALGPEARARDLRDGAAIVARWSAPVPAPNPRPPARFIGTCALAGASALVGVGLAFAQAEAGEMEALAEAAAAVGATGIAAAPERALLAIGLRADRAAGLVREAARLGFITAADDVRRNVIACVGAPACAAALMPARGIAEAVARAARPLLAAGGRIHLSGCAKGCASREPSTLAVAGTPAGAAIVTGGRVGDAPDAVVPPGRLVERIARLAALEPA